VSGSLLGWLIPSVLVLLSALFKISRQAGRIEEGVAGLYRGAKKVDERLDRLEAQVFTNRSSYRR
jgi:hypothetical protein